ncbi:AfsR/SARP family transcriptional regulator [Asanoa siamensis]|uniref:AfsR/SARP family transcriptional regulator n=1 Tax=Asanoa siamensis TaxID=926357 RepID=UPI001944241C|nr:BTAD domain-containing putative transcriptional regulator [Asanoa siamensis]
MDVSLDGRPVAVGTPKQQAVLALLALRNGQPVAVDSLVDDLWPLRPPASALANIQSYASHVRRIAGAARLVRRGTTYTLTLAEHELDLARFNRARRAAEVARAADDVAAELRHLDTAAGLWRGSVADGFRHGPVTAALCQIISDDYQAVVERMAELHLRAGAAPAAARLLRTHVRLHPLRESAYVLLMRALRASGDNAEALAMHDLASSNLAAQLGIRPGPQLQGLRALILNESRA